jgi:hypothetical protein
MVSSSSSLEGEPPGEVRVGPRVERAPSRPRPPRRRGAPGAQPGQRPPRTLWTGLRRERQPGPQPGTPGVTSPGQRRVLTSPVRDRRRRLRSLREVGAFLVPLRRGGARPPSLRSTHPRFPRPRSPRPRSPRPRSPRHPILRRRSPTTGGSPAPVKRSMIHPFALRSGRLGSSALTASIPPSSPPSSRARRRPDSIEASCCSPGPDGEGRSQRSRGHC